MKDETKNGVALPKSLAYDSLRRDKPLTWLAAIAGLSTAAIYVVKSLSRKVARPDYDLRGKIVLITGGSRGLGFALAHEFGRHGCRIALCARDAAELDEACKRLANDGIDSAIFPFDITKAADIDALLSRVIERFGRIDVLINNAGEIKVAPLASVEHADFEHAMDTMFWGPVNLTLAALPHLKSLHEAQIVNITSVGGRVSMPHLLPYSCAKFAFVGFSTGLSTEVAADNVHVATIVPGLMRTGSYLNAEFQGAPHEEFAWFGLLGNLPGFSVAAEYAATMVRKAVEKRQYNCTISLPAKILVACEALIPEVTRALLASVNEFLLPSSGGSTQSSSGKKINPAFNSIFQGLTALGRRAAHQFNE